MIKAIKSFFSGLFPTSSLPEMQRVPPTKLPKPPPRPTSSPPPRSTRKVNRDKQKKDDNDDSLDLVTGVALFSLLSDDSGGCGGFDD